MRHLVAYYCLIAVLLLVSGVSVYRNVQLSNQVSQLNQLVLQSRGVESAADQNTQNRLTDLSTKVNQLSSGQASMQSQLKELQNRTADIDAMVH